MPSCDTARPAYVLARPYYLLALLAVSERSQNCKLLAKNTLLIFCIQILFIHSTKATISVTSLATQASL